MTEVPEFMPVLSAGSHPSPKEGACVMEYVSLIAGEPWSDAPSCTHPCLASAAQCVNDLLDEAARSQIVPLISRLMGTKPSGTREQIEANAVRLAVWSARHVLGEIPDLYRSIYVQCLEIAEAWADGTASATAANVVALSTPTPDWLLADDVPYCVSNAADAAMECAEAAASNHLTVQGAANACGSAVEALSNASDQAVVDFLVGLLDEYDRLTGRDAVPEVTDAELRRVAGLVGA